MIGSTRAIVRLGRNRAGDAANLRRLALFFDRVLYVLPEYWIVKDEVLNDPSRTERIDGKIKFKTGIDPFKDTIPRAKVPIGQLGHDLDETLEYLVGHGIAEECNPTAIAFSTDFEAFERAKNTIGWLDAGDPTFLSLSGTSDTTAPIQSQTAQVVSHSGRESEITSIYPIQAMVDSSDLTTTLYAAQHTSSSPVFTEASHHAELAYRYEQYKAGVTALWNLNEGHAPPTEFLNQLGSVAFHIGNAVLDSTQVDRPGVEDVVKLREALDESRRRFVSEHLVSATNLIEDNPWSPEVRSEIEGFVQGTLAAELLRFQDESRTRFEHLVGSFTGHLFDVTKYAVVGGVGGSVGLAQAAAGVTSASVIAGASPWQLALLAAAGALTMRSRAIVEDIAEAVFLASKERRSSMAYLAVINKSVVTR